MSVCSLQRDFAGTVKNNHGQNHVGNLISSLLNEPWKTIRRSGGCSFGTWTDVTSMWSWVTLATVHGVRPSLCSMCSFQENLQGILPSLKGYQLIKHMRKFIPVYVG